MSLERLWAGWRSAYVAEAAASSATGQPVGQPVGQAAEGPGATEGPGSRCVFCAILSSGLPDLESHVIWRHRSGRVAALLNAYPYTSGHFMAMPTRHVADLEELDAEESAALWEGLSLGVRALKAAYQPDGVNVGANLGRAAGAGVPGHFHLHVLPRWVGDTNFMTALAEARVLPEPLSGTASKLRAAWSNV